MGWVSEVEGFKKPEDADLLDEGENILHRALELLFLRCICAARQVTDDCSRDNLARVSKAIPILLTVRQVVIDGVFLGGQLREEQLGEVLDPDVLVLDTLRHLTELALDLDHSI